MTFSRSTRPRWRTLLDAIFVIGMLFGGVAFVSPENAVPSTPPEPQPEQAVRELESGWKLRVATRLPEEVSALAMAPTGNSRANGEIYIGTSSRGGVYRYNAIGGLTLLTIGEGLGDQIQFGTCCVSRLAIRDLDHDGTPELLASTSQISPRGRPRLYMWSFAGSTPILRSVTRPDIRSSWSHGLAFIERPGTGKESAFITFCGYGEVVEYQMPDAKEGDGFRDDTMSWKVVGQLPASGEWSQSADADNDGRIDVCLATGFAPNKGAIHICASDESGSALRLIHRIDEGGRFGNVRFHVGDLRGDGSQDIIAWWSSDFLYGGDCEIIRYRLGPEGVRERVVIGRGDAGSLWPDDGQVAMLDLDRDGTPEVWFATHSGNLWRYDASGSTALRRVFHIEGGLGPIVGGDVPNSAFPSLFLGWDKTVLRLELDRGPKDSSSDGRGRLEFGG